MSFERKIALAVDGSVAVEVTVAFIEHDNQPDELRVVVRRSPNEAPNAEAIWHVKEREGIYSLQITTQSVASGICLAGCLAGIVSGGGPLVECLKKAKDRKAVRSCIDHNAVAQAVGALSCIYGCLNM